MYRSRSAIKGQRLVDFIVEISNMRQNGINELLWILETDGSSKAAGGGASMVLHSPEGLHVTQTVKFSFSISNNIAEYEAILLGLRVAKS